MKRSHEDCTAEMSKGIFPPSLKFSITYEDGKVDDTRKWKAHTVSLEGCDERDEVTFGIVVFEPPISPLGMCMNVVRLPLDFRCYIKLSSCAIID